MTNRISPWLNLLTNELRWAHKKNRSTNDILKFLKIRILTKETNGIIIPFGHSGNLSKLIEINFGKYHMRKGYREKSMCNLIIGHGINYIRGKLNGKLSKRHNNMGVFRWIPLSDWLFIVYTDGVMRKYSKNI